MLSGSMCATHWYGFVFQQILKKYLLSLIELGPLLYRELHAITG